MFRPGAEIIRLQRVDSTNNYAAELLNNGIVTEGTAIMAYDQLKGRGQRGSSWKMVPNEDLAVSFIFYPKIEDVGAFVFNKAITLAICDTVRYFTGPGVTIKWPNDILFKGEKVGGILIELAWQSVAIKHAIVGIGLNLATSLYKDWSGVTSIGERYSDVLREEVLEKLCDCLGYWYAHLHGHNYEEIQTTYRDRLFKRGEIVALKGSAGSVEGVFETVNDVGSIILRTSQGSQEFAHGSYRLQMD